MGGTIDPHQVSLISWGVLAAGLVLVVSVWMTYIFARRDCPLVVRVATIWCWWCTFSIIYLLPIDLAPSMRTGDVLYHIWNFMYWTSFILAWTIIPIAWYYYEAGDFTPWSKFRTAIKSNIRFYLISATLLIAFLVYIAVEANMTGSHLLGFAICLSNTWGLTLYVLLLGYGLVEVPRSYWYEASLEKSLEFCYYKAAETHDLMDRAADDLVSTRQIIDRISRNLSGGYAFHNQLKYIQDRFEAIENVDLKMDGNLSDFSETTLYEELKEAKEPSLDLLKKTNVHVRNTVRKYFRLRDTLEDTAERGAWLQSLVARRSAPLATLCSQGASGVCSGMQLRWMLYWRGPTFKFTAMVLSCMSLLLMWSQLTIKAQFLSPLAIMYQSTRTSDDSTQVAMILPLAYLCACAFFSMFRLRLFDYYFMDSKRRTGEVSLLFNGTYLLRIFAAIGANFTVLVGAESTAFQRVMGAMDVVPFFGSAFNTYLPILISIFCLCTFFNVYGRILHFMGIEQFTYWSTNDVDKLQEGKAHVEAYSSSIRESRDDSADRFL